MLHRAAMGIVMATSWACLAREELVTVVRSGWGDLFRFTQDNACRNGRCPLRTPTLVVGGECVADTILQSSKQANDKGV